MNLKAKYSERAFEAYRNQNFVTSAKYFNAASKLDPRDEQSLSSGGIIFSWLMHYGESAKKYEEALSLKPNDHKILFNLGGTYLTLNDLGKERHKEEERKL